MIISLLAYVKKCKPAPTFFTPNYNLIQHTQQNDDQNPAMDFPLPLYNQSMSLYLSPPPFPTYHIISPPSTLAKLKQRFLWTKNTKAEDIFYPHGPKQVLNIFLQRIFTRSALAEKKDYVMSSPMTIQGAWTRPMPWTTRRKTAKSFS